MVLVRWTIGDVVRKLRSDRGWTQREFAAHAGMAVTAANRLEQNSDLSDQRTIQRAAKALGVSISLLYRYAEFTSQFGELNEGQQARVLELMQEFASMGAESPQPTVQSVPVATDEVRGSAARAKVQRRR